MLGFAAILTENRCALLGLGVGLGAGLGADRGGAGVASGRGSEPQRGTARERVQLNGRGTAPQAL